MDEDVEILNKIKSFYETLFKCQSSKIVSEIESVLWGTLLHPLTTIK